MNSHETKCPHCEAILAKVNLKRHIRTVHDKQKDHKCDLCGKEYFAKKRLNEHIKRDHDKIRDEKCNQCGKFFFTKELLKSHVRNIHSKDQNQKVHEEVKYDDANDGSSKVVENKGNDKIYCEKCGSTQSTVG